MTDPNQQNRLWFRDTNGKIYDDTTGEYKDDTVMDKIFIRDPADDYYHEGLEKTVTPATEITKVWIRDETGALQIMYPTTIDPQNTLIQTIVWDHFCQLEQGDLDFGISIHPSFVSSWNYLPIESIGSPVGSDEDKVGTSIYHFRSGGVRNPDYGNYIWNTTATSTPPLLSREWGYVGSVVRRIPKINTTASCPVEWVSLMYTRPALRKFYQGWNVNSDTWAWTREAGSHTLEEYPVEDNVPYLTNVPGLAVDLEYYEYIPQGIKGTSVSNQFSLTGNPVATTKPCDCGVTSNLNAFGWPTSSENTPDLSTFGELPRNTSSPEEFTYQDLDTSLPYMRIDQRNGSVNPPDAKTGRWVVIDPAKEPYASQWPNATHTTSTPCSGSTHQNLCNLSTANTEKEYIVAFVANWQSDGSTRYEFDYTVDNMGADFYSTTASVSPRWDSWDGDGYVFLFMRFTSSTFNHTDTDHGYPRPPVMREFWIQPKAWKYVNGTGTAWSSNYIGIVLESLPSMYTVPCSMDSNTSDILNIHHAMQTLPKYYYWNMPIPKCTGETYSSDKTTVSGSSGDHEHFYGTYPAYVDWTDSTGRVDLMGCGNSSFGGFDPAPSTWGSNNCSDESCINHVYSIDLLKFNKHFGSMSGFPYGIGHGYGRKYLSPQPACACTANNSGSISGFSDYPELNCPCPEAYEVGGSTGYECGEISAQPTGGYMLDKTNTNTVGDWTVTDWSTLGWKKAWCGDPDDISYPGGGVCGCSRDRISECNRPDLIDNMPGCNSPTCWDCLSFMSGFGNEQLAYCNELGWDQGCIDALLLYCSYNPITNTCTNP